MACPSGVNPARWARIRAEFEVDLFTALFGSPPKEGLDRALEIARLTEKYRLEEEANEKAHGRLNICPDGDQEGAPVGRGG